MCIGLSQPGREGTEVTNKMCRYASRWDVIDADDDNYEDDSKYAVCKFKLKKAGGICAGRDNDELKLMDCDDEATRMKWFRNGQIQSMIVQDSHSYWEVCDEFPDLSRPKYCYVALQNPIEDNGEQHFVLSGTDLVLKGNDDACVTYEGSRPNEGDGLFLGHCDDTTDTRWVAKCLD